MLAVTIITYSAPKHILVGVLERGPICVDGVSLTVIAQSKRAFSVSGRSRARTRPFSKRRSATRSTSNPTS